MPASKTVVICYNSVFNPQLQNLSSVSDLIAYAEATNKKFGISGHMFNNQKLVHCRQYLEGPAAVVDVLFYVRCKRAQAMPSPLCVPSPYTS